MSAPVAEPGTSRRSALRQFIRGADVRRLHDAVRPLWLCRPLQSCLPLIKTHLAGANAAHSPSSINVRRRSVPTIDSMSFPLALYWRVTPRSKQSPAARRLISPPACKSHSTGGNIGGMFHGHVGLEAKFLGHVKHDLDDAPSASAPPPGAARIDL